MRHTVPAQLDSNLVDLLDPWILMDEGSYDSVCTLKPKGLLQLRILDLTRNQLSGSLPGSWAGMSQASHALKPQLNPESYSANFAMSFS